MNAGPRIEVVIDRLAVHGMDRREAAAVRGALSARLEELAGRWLDGSAPLPRGGSRPSLRLPPLPATGRRDRGRDLGRHAAEALFTALSSPSPTPPEPPRLDAGADP